MSNQIPDIQPIGDEALARIEAAMIEGEAIRRGHPIPQIAMTETYNPSYHDVRALIARLRAAEARQQWRPISDAPRDGTNIDVWVGGEFPRRIADVSWREPTDSEWWVHGGDTIDVPDATWFDGFGPLGRDQPPTHWLPLPPPPEGAA